MVDIKPGVVPLDGAKLFADPDLLVINFEGENFYRACGEKVRHLEEGAMTTCVKRLGHVGDIHEDYDGRTRNDYDLKLGDKPLEQAVFETLGAVSACWEHIERAGIFDSTRAKNYGDQLMDRINQAGPIYG